MTTMMRTALVLLLALATVGCTTTAPPPPEPVSDAGRRLIDPLTGFESESPLLRESSALAWSDFQSGRLSSAEQRWQQIASTQPDYSPAIVGLATIAIARGDFPRAAELVRSVPAYPAATVVRAELLASENRVIEAAELLQPMASQPGTSAAIFNRYDALRQSAVAQLRERAMAATGSERIETLQRAVRLAPQDREVRLPLVEELITAGRFADARETLQPSIEADAALNRVQAALAEIEIGEQKYQNAIRRYERLVEKTGDVVYRERLERTKRLWHESTLPPQFQLAVKSPNITREQLAVLLFWKLPSIRFAQNLQQPPIVVDIAEVMGREELIRVLTMNLLPVDRSTRTARPRRTVTAGEFLTAAASAMKLVSEDPCTTADAPSAAARLAACGIDTLRLEADPEGFVTGAAAATVLDQIAGLDRSR